MAMKWQEAEDYDELMGLGSKHLNKAYSFLANSSILLAKQELEQAMEQFFLAYEYARSFNDERQNKAYRAYYNAKVKYADLDKIQEDKGRE